LSSLYSSLVYFRFSRLDCFCFVSAMADIDKSVKERAIDDMLRQYKSLFSEQMAFQLTEKTEMVRFIASCVSPLFLILPDAHRRLLACSSLPLMPNLSCESWFLPLLT
jgi:hypothetical protein